MTAPRYDLAVVGAGIVGLAHALVAARKGLRVLVIDRDSQANGASIRNFGFITVTGQSRGAIWQRARRSRDVWAEIAVKARIPIVTRSACVIAHSEQALGVLEEFAATEMGADCRLLTLRELEDRIPMARVEGTTGALWSPHELRIEARTALPALASYLETELGVVFARGIGVHSVATPELFTSAGRFYASRVVVASGPDLFALFPEAYAAHAVKLCKLQMLRLAPQPENWRLAASIMSDFALVRYAGFSALPAAAVLAGFLAAEQPEIVAYGIHLIVVQSADGSLVVGDSHEYGATIDPFYSTAVEAAIVRLAEMTLRVPARGVIERWIGIYPQSDLCEFFVEAPQPHTRVVAVTTGNGMSTAFGLAEEVVAAL